MSYCESVSEDTNLTKLDIDHKTTQNTYHTQGIQIKIIIKLNDMTEKYSY